MEMDIWTKQLDDKRDRGGIRNQCQERLVLKQAGPQVQMVILRLIQDLWLFEKRLCSSVARFGQALNDLFTQSVAQHQKTVLIKGFSLLRFEVNKIQWPILLATAIKFYRRPRRTTSATASERFSEWCRTGIALLKLDVFDNAAMLHLVVDGSQNSSIGKHRPHIFFGMKDIACPFLFRCIRLNVFSLEV